MQIGAAGPMAAMAAGHGPVSRAAENGVGKAEGADRQRLHGLRKVPGLLRMVKLEVPDGPDFSSPMSSGKGQRT
jgi:hypothetical protein